MKSRVTLLFVSAFFYVNVAEASLDEILAPLPEIERTELDSDEGAVYVSETGKKELRSQDQSKSNPEVDAPEASIEEVEFVPPRKPITEIALLKAIEEEVDALLKPAGQVSLSPLRQLPIRSTL